MRNYGNDGCSHSSSLQPPVASLFRDDRLVVLDKPSGLLAVPGRGAELQDCLSARVKAELPQALVVHRLDRDTSGLMVMALDAAAQRELSRQFAERMAEKLYLAVVFGSVQPDAGVVELPLCKDFDRPPRHRIDPLLGRPACTHWRVLERSADRTRLELRPVTGRSHQIRVHLAAMGWPILGDNLYAHEAARGMAPRLLLHAWRLAIQHPDDGRSISWTAPCPF
jgi:tRNA pseudouridine32 synthase / 23S rRNA pseudouridine746 synthase